MKQYTKIKLFLSIFSIIAVFIYSPFFTKDIYAAELTAPTLTSNSVTLHLAGGNPGAIYIFGVTGPSIPAITLFKEVTADSAGSANASFDQLIALQSFTGSVGKYDPVTDTTSYAGFNTTNFTTLPATFIADEVTEASAVLRAVGLVQNGKYKIEVKNTSNSYNETFEVTATANGGASLSISNLEAEQDYEAEMFAITSLGTSFPAGTDILHFKTEVNDQQDQEEDQEEDDPAYVGTVGVDKAFAEWLSFVPCGNDIGEIKTDSKGKETRDSRKILNPCTFDHIIIAINRVVKSLLFVFAVPLAAIMFTYAGFLLLFSGGDSHKRTKAKGIFINVALGLAAAAAAWLIISTILSLLGYDGSWIGF